ncbi:four-domain proteases inhibitor-like [Saccostrea cucullata]|uniref:four-domain proteases inhibitor-like n=1 Tax=Saccostrea cuccullata TaxID=36930 RepID=UPI002ED60D34
MITKESVFLLGLILTSTGCIDPQAICNQLLGIDCNNYTPLENDESVCGTNGVHYENYCQFGKARCVDPSIDIKQVGHCHVHSGPQTSTVPATTAAAVTTAAPAVTTQGTTTTTRSFEMQLVCANANLITCTNEISLICGSDFKLYQNSCKFTLAMCQTPGLHNLTLADCRSHQGRRAAPYVIL